MSLVTSGVILDISHSPCYVFIATTSGIDIVNSKTQETDAYVLLSGIRSIHHNPESCFDLLYLATASGVYALPTLDSLNGDLSGKIVKKYDGAYYLPSSDVYKIHGNINNELTIATSSGIVYMEDKVGYIGSYSGIPTSCFISDDGSIYYSVYEEGLYVKKGPITEDWSVSDYQVTTTGNFPLQSDLINDIYVNTISGSVYVWLATGNGLLSYEEDLENLEASASGSKFFLQIGD